MCRNCGAHAPLAYCPVCGQDTALHPPTLREFVHEFVGHYVALEGKLWRTLAKLLFIPGALTLDYLRGRKARYINPLRLYLTFSVLMFAAISLSGNVVKFEDKENLTASERAEVESIKERFKPQREATGDNSKPGWLQQRTEHFKQLSPNERVVRLRSVFWTYAPYALFFLVPVLALLLKVFYLKRGMVYGEHLVAAFHAQTVLFIFGIIFSLDPPDWLAIVLGLFFAAHVLLGLKRVYRGRWWPTLLRTAALSSIYALFLAVTLLAVILAAVVG
jgi:hypothetical protein